MLLQRRDDDTLEQDLNTDLAVLQSHMDGMLDRVRQNSMILRKFRTFEMKLLNLNSLTDIIEHILENAKNYFDLDLISLCLIDEKGEIARFLQEDGYEYEHKEGLMLLESKELLKSSFGFSIQPYIGTYRAEKCFNFFSRFAQQPASVAITPLKRRGRYLGALNLGSFQAERFADNMATDFVDHLISVVSVCLENNLNFETIRRTSFIDTLTGVNNRRFLDQRIDEELDRCQRNSEPTSCLFLDIDFFKLINDKYGHQAGDRVLTLVASTIKTQLRSNDVLARYGGEEFVALLSNINETRSLEIAERIRKTVQALVIEFENLTINITISIGSATYIPGILKSARRDTAARLIKLADTALYQAKKNGRNRVENGGLVLDDASGSIG